MSLDNIPLVLCGDLNSDPKSSAIHYLMNKEYTLTKDRTDSKTGLSAYKTRNGRNLFKKV